MKSIEMFRELVRSVDASDIPIKYIAAASYLDDHGMENVVTGDDLDDLMARRLVGEVGEINLILDLNVMAIDVMV
jgi:hypothetical protein